MSRQRHPRQKKRFGCKLGKLSAAPPMPLEEQQAKDWVETKFRTIEANKIFRQKGLAAELQQLRKHLVGCQIGLTGGPHFGVRSLDPQK